MQQNKVVAAVSRPHFLRDLVLCRHIIEPFATMKGLVLDEVGDRPILLQTAAHAAREVPSLVAGGDSIPSLQAHCHATRAFMAKCHAQKLLDDTMELFAAPLPLCDPEQQKDAFRLISRMGSVAYELLYLPGRRYPQRLLAIVEHPQLKASIMREWGKVPEPDRICAFGRLTTSLLTTYGSEEMLASAHCAAELLLLRWMSETDIVAVEVDHAQQRRRGSSERKRTWRLCGTCRPRGC